MKYFIRMLDATVNFCTVSVSLQSAEEGEEAGVRGWVGQKLLDLSIKLKEYMFVTFINWLAAYLMN